MSKTTKGKLSDLTPDDRNANQHSEFGTSLLEKSMRTNGVGRSIVVSKDNKIIAGNGVAETAAGIGLEKTIVVETTGDEIVVVKRMDIASGTKEFYDLALADNIVAQKNIVMDAEVVEAIAEDFPGVIDWAQLVEGIKPQIQPGINLPDSDKANMCQMTFTLSGSQGAEVVKAVKVAKQMYKEEFVNTDNENSNGNALFFIVKAFLANADVQLLTEAEEPIAAGAKVHIENEPGFDSMYTVKEVLQNNTISFEETDLVTSILNVKRVLP